MNNKEMSYILWLGIIFGFGGLHRLYNGKIGSGILWLLTWGFFGIGQVVDLFLIPEMVDEHNLKYQARLGVPYAPERPVIARTYEAESKPVEESLTVRLLKAAQTRNSRISVTQGVADTGADFVEVEAALLDMAKKGYAGIQNDSHTGAVVYVFPEL